MLQVAFYLPWYLSPADVYTAPAEVAAQGSDATSSSAEYRSGESFRGRGKGQMFTPQAHLFGWCLLAGMVAALHGAGPSQFLKW